MCPKIVSYILYSPDFRGDYYNHNPEIVKGMGGEDFFNPLPNFNCGWVCIPKGIHLDIKEIYEIAKHDVSNWCAIQTASAVMIIKNKFKTKMVPKNLMVTKENDLKNKTLVHTAPYGLDWRNINV